MPSLASLAFTVFILILFAGIYLTLFDLLGTVIIFIDVFLYALFTGFDRVSGKIILFLLLISIIVETIDFFLVMTGTLQPATTKRVFWISAYKCYCRSVYSYAVFLGTGHMGRIFFRRIYRNHNVGSGPAIEIKISLPSVQSSYNRHGRKKNS